MRDRMSLILSLLVMLAAAPVVLADNHRGDMNAPPWSYEGRDGPTYWGRLSPAYHACDAGREQSPVNITGAAPAMGEDLDIRWNPGVIAMENTGKTIRVSAPPGSGLIYAGERYEFTHYTFHHHSEHLVEGRPYTMEIQFHHRSKNGDGVALAVFVEPGVANPAIETLWRQLPQSPGEESRSVELLLPTGLLPADPTTWRYAGSRTTPPCSEDLLWFVYRQPITASVEQINAFKRIYPMNTRPVQPLNRRMILLDFF
jgi:carbonic anhydrase